MRATEFETKIICVQTGRRPNNFGNFNMRIRKIPEIVKLILLFLQFALFIDKNRDSFINICT